MAFLSAFDCDGHRNFGAIISINQKKLEGPLLSINNILMAAPDVKVGASFLILFTTVKYQLGFYLFWLATSPSRFPLWSWWSATTQGNEPGYGQCCYDLGATSVQMLQRDHVAVSDSAIIAGYFMAFTIRFDDFAVTFFVNRKWLYNLCP